MKNKYLFLIFFIFLFVIFLSGCNEKPSQTLTPSTENTPPIIVTQPVDTQAPPADVQTPPADVQTPPVTEPIDAPVVSDTQNQPENPAPPVTIKSSYDLIEEALAKKYNKDPEDFLLGIKKLTLTHFLGIVNKKEGIVLAAKQNNNWVIVFDSVFGEKKTYTCNEVATYKFPPDMIGDCTK